MIAKYELVNIGHGYILLPAEESVKVDKGFCAENTNHYFFCPDMLEHVFPGIKEGQVLVSDKPFKDAILVKIVKYYDDQDYWCFYTVVNGEPYKSAHSTEAHLLSLGFTPNELYYFKLPI